MLSTNHIIRAKKLIYNSFIWSSCVFLLSQNGSFGWRFQLNRERKRGKKSRGEIMRPPELFLCLLCFFLFSIYKNFEGVGGRKKTNSSF